MLLFRGDTKQGMESLSHLAWQRYLRIAMMIVSQWSCHLKSF